MMRQRVPEELPVLTDLIVEEIEIDDAGHRLRRGQPIRRARSQRAPNLQHRQWPLHASQRHPLLLRPLRSPAG